MATRKPTKERGAQPTPLFDELVDVAPPGLCQCGCGQKTTVPDGSVRGGSYVKGRPMRYIRGHQQETQRLRNLAKAKGLCLCQACKQELPPARFSKACRVCKDCQRVRLKRFTERNPELMFRMHRDKNLRRDFGITLEEYEVMFVRQNGLCAICGRPERKQRKDGAISHLAVDHSHITNRIRGLLCYDCNLTIGKFKDDPVILRAAAAYLEEYAARGEPIRQSENEQERHVVVKGRHPSERRTCQRCPTEFETFSPLARFCPACREVVRRERGRARHRARVRQARLEKGARKHADPLP